MDRAAALLAAIKAFVGNPQFPVIAATAIFVTVGVLWGRRWYLARTNGHAGGIVADAFAVVAPYLVGLLIPGLALFAAGGEPRPWFETAATLLALLALIRLVMFLLRLSLGKSRTIKTWELRATLIVWAVIAAEVLGWLDPVIAQLDSIGLAGGKTRITIWSVLKAIATVTVFVVVSVWVARWIDKRISAIKELAPSTRIGIGKVRLRVPDRLRRAVRPAGVGRRPDRAHRLLRRDRPRTRLRPAGDRRELRQRLRAADRPLDQARRRHQLHRQHGHQHHRVSAGSRNCAGGTS